MGPDRLPARRPACRHRRGLAVALLALVGMHSGAASAQALGAEDSHGVATTQQAGPDWAPKGILADPQAPGVGVRSDLGWRWEARPRARHPLAAIDLGGSGPAAAAAIEYRLWFGDPHTEVGLGLAPRARGRIDGIAAPEIAPGAAPGLVLAMRHRMSEHARLTFDAPLTGSADALTGRPQRTALDLGIESSLLQGLAKGHLLRAQLDAQSSLTLRLRGGRVGLFLATRISAAP